MLTQPNNLARKSVNESRQMKMNKPVQKSRILGIAFLIQSVIPILANVLFLSPLIHTGDAAGTLIDLASHPVQLRIGVLGEMITALGIIFLGVVLYQALRKENEIMALTGMSFYILEAVLVTISRSSGIVLLNMGNAYMSAGQPAAWLPLASTLLDSMELNYTLAMFAFSTGAPFLYYLLYRSNLVPRWLSLWGLVTAIGSCLVATVGKLMGFAFPFWYYLPYMPFEFVIGLWILFKGIPVIRSEPGLEIK